MLAHMQSCYCAYIFSQTQRENLGQCKCLTLMTTVTTFKNVYLHSEDSMSEDDPFRWSNPIAKGDELCAWSHGDKRAAWDAKNRGELISETKNRECIDILGLLYITSTIRKSTRNYYFMTCNIPFVLVWCIGELKTSVSLLLKPIIRGELVSDSPSQTVWCETGDVRSGELEKPIAQHDDSSSSLVGENMPRIVAFKLSFRVCFTGRKYGKAQSWLYLFSMRNLILSVFNCYSNLTLHYH